MESFTIAKGNRLPQLRATILDENGDPVDLTSSSVSFRLKRVGATTVLFTSAAVVIQTGSGDSIVDKGVVEYVWGVTDTATEGSYEGNFLVTIAGKVQEYPGGDYIPVSVYADDPIDSAALVFCTVAQARVILSQDFDVQELALAQLVIALKTGVDPLTDANSSTAYDLLPDQDKVGLKQATVLQAKWMRSQPDFFERMNMLNEAADGESRQYGPDDMVLAPMAKWALRNTRFDPVGYRTVATPRDHIVRSLAYVRDSGWRPFCPWSQPR